MLNIHTHRPGGQPGIVEIENLRFGQSGHPQSTWCSAGLHPWFLQENELAEALEWLKKMAAQKNVVAIGEAGLDKVTDTPWDLQQTAFEHCAKTAEIVQKPLVIHCVRAFSEIIFLKKQWKPTQPWVIHGFNKNPETAEMLLHAGCYLSFGAALLQANSRAAEALKQTPASRFFLETDNAEISIGEIYRQAAAIRDVPVAQLTELVAENGEAVFFRHK